MGVILYRLLTGQPPHDLSGDPPDVYNRIAGAEVRHPRQAASDLDADLVAILLKALARDPARRYPSAGGLAGDLNHYLNGEVVGAREPTVLYFLRKKIAKNRGPVVVG